MSMRTISVVCKGLLIPNNVLEYVVSHTKNWEGHHAKFADYLYDIDPYLEYLEDDSKLGDHYVSVFYYCEGDMMNLEETKYSDVPENEYDSDRFAIIELKKYPSLFERAYRDIDEVVAEYKLSVGKYLPKDFDYKKYLVTFIGTCVG